MSLDDAIAADRSGELRMAAAHYEAVLAGGGPSSIEVLLNLAVLYWQATETGMAAAKKLTPDFLAVAARRPRELLLDAERRFPTSTEQRFWTRYIAWADLGEPFSSEECRDLLRQDPAVLVPAMHVFAATQGNEAEAEALELLRRCHEDGTTRARYIASVIEGVLRRRSWDAK